MRIPSSLIVVLAMGIASVAVAQDAKPNYDESKIPAYTLPNPLAGVESAVQWPARREQILAQFATEMFGKVPTDKLNAISVKDAGARKPVLGGKATMWQPVITLAGRDLHLLVLLPKESRNVPAFLAYNFHGNHTVLDDLDIPLTKNWVRSKPENRASDEDRGSAASRWAVEKIIDNGFALVTLYYGDVDPDVDDGFENGVHAAFPNKPASDQWGSIATWAWGLSRVLDFLGTTSEIDATRVAVMGHSRLGKTSLWAGANDPRFALAISNNSGCGGAAISRRRIGESVARINTVFPHWFCDNFVKYNDNESQLPFDQHMLVALMAPRPVYVASAVEDTWADPRGEFLAAKHATPVYELLGREGLPAAKMPPVDEPSQGSIGYHVRSGGHSVTDFDWTQYIKFAKQHLMENE
ncbi:acetyl xylan esterase [Rhodopirellula maiorica SM1]|uniref:Acetyl xylan esterase n=1 Tax=Rhodopirellula maiorica SM1 TaxID=1265738 RepID=M5REE0_9BACT|nr:acetylxylan esterase [Rhodopirellula maiorica]EMI17456.1 acetyl xylan esterase [Rhodopirellula maiorica SM1]